MEQMQADLNSSEEAQNQEPETSTATPPEENSKPEENAAPEESASQETPAEPTPPAGQQAPETPPEPPRNALRLPPPRRGPSTPSAVSSPARRRSTRPNSRPATRNSTP
jgi:hypothetical protein